MGQYNFIKCCKTEEITHTYPCGHLDPDSWDPSAIPQKDAQTRIPQ